MRAQGQWRVRCRATLTYWRSVTHQLFLRRKILADLDDLKSVNRFKCRDIMNCRMLKWLPLSADGQVPPASKFLLDSTWNKEEKLQAILNQGLNRAAMYQVSDDTTAKAVLKRLRKAMHAHVMVLFLPCLLLSTGVAAAF